MITGESFLKEKLTHIMDGETPSREELAAILALPSPEYLYHTADLIRQEQCHDAVLLRGIIEISNVCNQSCHYCGLRKENKTLFRYRMTEEEIMDAAQKIQRADISTAVLQSGEDKTDAKRLCDLIRRIRTESDLFITLSLGERPAGDYLAFREAGADRYLLKHETASKQLFEILRPGSSYNSRREALRLFKELELETGTGCMVGLPGQTPEDLADDLLYMKALGADMIGIGPFIPHPETPLAHCPPGTTEMTLKMISLTRLLLPRANIPATTSLGVLDSTGRRKALQSGANVVMLDFTPENYRRHYDIYPGKTYVAREQDHTLRLLRQELEAMGRTIGRDRPRGEILKTSAKTASK
ncbi:MAG: [FeFe] hydrogenase H-cluster radical SAM maturase HydE [Syntrophobacterales bacterium]|jgi:biotin synthase|nr:[FeFe] hydrogenase H-cluster radical SAM maturase HydE [Syntrophobacterales bacterium]